MKGFVEHLINSDTEVLNELELETLNESENVDDIINDELDLDDEFANEEEPGDLGDNIDGVTNLDIDLDMESDDLWPEHSSDPTDDLEGFEDLDESEDFEDDEDDVLFEEEMNQQNKIMQAYQGWSDEDLEDEALFEECLNQGGPGSGRKYKPNTEYKSKATKQFNKASKSKGLKKVGHALKGAGYKVAQKYYKHGYNL